MSSKWKAFAEILTMFTDHLDKPMSDDGFTRFKLIYEQTVGNYLTCQKQVPGGTDYWEDATFKRWTLRCVQITADNVNEEVAKRKSMQTNEQDVENGMKCAVRMIKKYYCKNLPKCKDEKATQRGPVCALYEESRKLDDDFAC